MSMAVIAPNGSALKVVGVKFLSKCTKKNTVVISKTPPQEALVGFLVNSPSVFTFIQEGIRGFHMTSLIRRALGVNINLERFQKDKFSHIDI